MNPTVSANESTREFAENPFGKPYRIVLFCVILGLLLFTRLFDLGSKTMMHDELLFVHYTHAELFKSWLYLYLPILHGPVMLQFQNLVFHIFGVTDYTARLGVALLGIGSFFFLWRLRFWIGEVGTWFMLLFYTLSPGITFFQRFFHQDAMYMFCTVWILCSFAEWWRTRDGRWIASGIVACTVLFTNKASALFVYFSIVTFLVLLLLHDITAYFLEGKSSKIADYLKPVPRFPNPLWPALIFCCVVTLCLVQIFEGIIYDSDVRQAIGHDWILKDVRSIPLALGWTVTPPELAPDADGLNEGSFWRRFYLLLGVGGFLLFGIIKIAVEKRVGYREFTTDLWRRIHANRLYILGAIAASIAIYLSIYTTFFKHKIGFFEIYSRTWSYWGGQHEWGRISGPFHQHALNLLVYELPSVLIIAAAWCWGIFKLQASRTLGVAWILMMIAVAAFHKLMFSGMEYLPSGSSTPLPMQINFLKNVLFMGLAAGIIVILFPRAVRAVAALSLTGLLLYAVAFFSGPRWNSLMGQSVYKHGEPVFLSGRHVTLADFIEIQFNFDGGWNLVLVLVLIFFATLYAWHAIGRGERFHGFVVWWAVTMFGSAAYAREAVPQVGIHVMLPTIVLAGSILSRAWPQLQRLGIKPLAWGLLGFAVLWNAKATFNLNLIQPNEPRERMAYAPLNDDVLAHMNFIRDYHRIAPIRLNDRGQTIYTVEPNSKKTIKDVRIYMRPLDQVTWPAKWYLRDIEYSEGSAPETAIKEGWDFIFLEVADLDRFPELKENYNIARGRGTTFWTPSPISLPVVANLWKEMIPGHNLDGTPHAADAFRAKEEGYRLWRYMLHREYFDGTNRGYPSISSFEYLFCWRKDLY